MTNFIPEELTAFFDGLRHVEEQIVDDQTKKLDTFFREYHLACTKQQECWRRTASRFNIFEAIKIDRNELRHSAMLAYLLDPAEHHDQGTFFLDSFLKECLKTDLTEIDGLEHARVTLEHSVSVADDTRADNTRGRRMDIVIFLPDGRIIGIENKVDAAEGDNQVSDYQRWLDQQPHPSGMKPLLVFLTPDGRPPKDSIPNSVTVLSLSYRQLGLWLQALVSSDPPDRLCHVLCMYADVCLKVGGDV